MLKNMSLEYWIDDGWFVGRLKEAPHVFSQGETLEELIENIRDAYQLLLETAETVPCPAETTVVEVALEAAV